MPSNFFGGAAAAIRRGVGGKPGPVVAVDPSEAVKPQAFVSGTYNAVPVRRGDSQTVPEQRQRAFQELLRREQPPIYYQTPLGNANVGAVMPPATTQVGGSSVMSEPAAKSGNGQTAIPPAPITPIGLGTPAPPPEKILPIAGTVPVPTKAPRVINVPFLGTLHFGK